jgi:hypothetical protein
MLKDSKALLTSQVTKKKTDIFFHRKRFNPCKTATKNTRTSAIDNKSLASRPEKKAEHITIIMNAKTQAHMIIV